MSILDSLAREHRLMRGLLDRLEDGFVQGGKGGDHSGKTLLVLFQALDRHERIEDLIFGSPSFASGREARSILAEVSRQHRKIATLRRGLDDVLRGRYPWEILRALVLELAGKLRQHFDAEESRLWPRYRKNPHRTQDRSLDRRAREQVLALGRNIQEMWAAVDVYVGERRI